MSQLSKLREDHASLARMFRQLRGVIRHSSAPEQLVLFGLRRELMSTLIAHLKLEDWALYPRLIESGDGEISDTGRAFQDEMGGLAPASSLIATSGMRPRSRPTGPAIARTPARSWTPSRTGSCAKTASLPLLEKLNRAA